MASKYAASKTPSYLEPAFWFRCTLRLWASKNVLVRRVLGVQLNDFKPLTLQELLIHREELEGA